MGIKISERIKEHLLEWDETRGDLILKEYQESTTLNPSNNEYNMELVATKKVGGGDYANMFDFSSNTVTTIAASDTWYKLQCVSTSVYRKGFAHTNNRLTKVGDGYNPIKLECNTSITSSNNKLIQAAFFKNGNIIPCSLGEVVTASGGKGSTIAFHCMTEMNDGDYVEIWIKNKTASSNITLDVFNVIVTELT
jgi:hypothetical protein